MAGHTIVSSGLRKVAAGAAHAAAHLVHGHDSLEHVLAGSPIISTGCCLAFSCCWLLLAGPCRCLLSSCTVAEPGPGILLTGTGCSDSFKGTCSPPQPARAGSRR